MKYLKCPKCGEFFEENLESCPSCGWSESSSSPKVTMGEKVNVAITDTGTKDEEELKDSAQTSWKESKNLVMFLVVMLAVIIYILYKEKTDFCSSFVIVLFGVFAVNLMIWISSITKSVLTVIANISINLHEINMKIKEEKTTEQ